MNLELIKEINDLKLANHSYTEIAEITGIARTTLVLSFRLSTLFEQTYELKTSSLQSEIHNQQFIIKALEKSITDKDTEIKRLTEFVDISDDDMVITKKEYENLKDELVESLQDVDMLNSQLNDSLDYLDDLSFIDKLKLLFL